MILESAIAKVTGSESERFLQNLLATDISKIPNGSGSMACLLNHQGKVKFTFSLHRYKDFWLISTKKSDLQLLLDDLSIFTLRTQVKITLVNNYRRRIFKKKGGVNKLNQSNLLASYSLGENLIDTISIDNTPLDKEDFSNKTLAIWEDLISNGIPYIGHQHQLKYTSAILGLNELGAISNNKGCYPGQEIVNKLSRVGLLKRCLAIFSLQPDKKINIGDEIFCEGENIGNILNYENGNYCLAVLLRSYADKDCYVGQNIKLIPIKIVS